MLSNNGLCLHTTAQYVLLFLVLAVNSARFQSYTLLLDLATRSYALFLEPTCHSPLVCYSKPKVLSFFHLMSTVLGFVAYNSNTVQPARLRRSLLQFL